MTEKIIEFFLQVGTGSIFGVILGVIFQYLVSKKLKIFETKLVIFRRVYKQLYYFTLLNEEQIFMLSEKKGVGISSLEAAERSGLDLRRDLGDILYYVDGDLETRIANLIYNLYQEAGVINKNDLDEIYKIMIDLKKVT